MALNDAMSRVAAIAIVHETLSQAFDEVVDFDKVADGLLRMVVDVAATRDGVRAVRIGSFGEVSADVATSLSMVITELCQNAVEHGLSRRTAWPRARCRSCPASGTADSGIEISDDGRGLPDDFDGRASPSLGLSIVNTLVSDMGGEFRLGQNPQGRGTAGSHRGPVEEEEALTDSAQAVRAASALGGMPCSGGPNARVPRSGGPNTRACRATLEGAALVLAQSAPHTVVLAGLEGPLQARVPDVAATTDLLRLLDLEQSGSGVPDREKQLRILVQTGSLVAPIHVPLTPSSRCGPAGRTRILQHVSSRLH